MVDIKLEYGTAPNGNAGAGGFLPMLRVNGKRRGDTWAAKGYDDVTALVFARADAQREAARYSGDWKITITEAV